MIVEALLREGLAASRARISTSALQSLHQCAQKKSSTGCPRSALNGGRTVRHPLRGSSAGAGLPSKFSRLMFLRMRSGREVPANCFSCSRRYAMASGRSPRAASTWAWTSMAAPTAVGSQGSSSSFLAVRKRDAILLVSAGEGVGAIEILGRQGCAGQPGKRGGRVRARPGCAPDRRAPSCSAPARSLLGDQAAHGVVQRAGLRQRAEVAAQKARKARLTGGAPRGTEFGGIAHPAIEAARGSLGHVAKRTLASGGFANGAWCFTAANRLAGHAGSIQSTGSAIFFSTLPWESMM